MTTRQLALLTQALVRHTAPVEQVEPQLPQLLTLLVMSLQTPPQHALPAPQQTPRQGASPGWHVKQSVPAKLQPFAQVVVGAMHCALVLHVAASVLMLLVQDCAGPHELVGDLLLVSVQTD